MAGVKFRNCLGPHPNPPPPSLTRVGFSVVATPRLTTGRKRGRRKEGKSFWETIKRLPRQSNSKSFGELQFLVPTFEFFPSSPLPLFRPVVSLGVATTEKPTLVREGGFTRVGFWICPVNHARKFGWPPTKVSRVLLSFQALQLTHKEVPTLVGGHFLRAWFTGHIQKPTLVREGGGWGKNLTPAMPHQITVPEPRGQPIRRRPS